MIANQHFITLLLCTFTLHATAFASDPPQVHCPPNGIAYLPHPQNCSQFFRCANGVAQQRHCPRPLQWHAHRQICVYSNRTQCRVEQDQPTDAFACISGQYYAHERSCAKFYYCERGVRVLLHCGIGLHWHQRRQRCDSPRIAHCPNAQPPTETVVNGATYPGCPPPGYNNGRPTFLPYPGDCTRFLNCADGRVWAMECPRGLLWSKQRNRCDYDVKCDNWYGQVYEYSGESMESSESNESNESYESYESRSESDSGDRTSSITKTSHWKVTAEISANTTTPTFDSSKWTSFGNEESEASLNTEINKTPELTTSATSTVVGSTMRESSTISNVNYSGLTENVRTTNDIIDLTAQTTKGYNEMLNETAITTINNSDRTIQDGMATTKGIQVTECCEKFVTNGLVTTTWADQMTVGVVTTIGEYSESTDDVEKISTKETNIDEQTTTVGATTMQHSEITVPQNNESTAGDSGHRSTTEPKDTTIESIEAETETTTIEKLELKITTENSQTTIRDVETTPITVVTTIGSYETTSENSLHNEKTAVSTKSTISSDERTHDSFERTTQNDGTVPNTTPSRFDETSSETVRTISVESEVSVNVETTIPTPKYFENPTTSSDFVAEPTFEWNANSTGDRLDTATSSASTTNGDSFITNRTAVPTITSEIQITTTNAELFRTTNQTEILIPTSTIDPVLVQSWSPSAIITTPTTNAGSGNITTMPTSIDNTINRLTTDITAITKITLTTPTATATPTPTPTPTSIPTTQTTNYTTVYIPTTTIDPRLPFRATHCQDTANRNKFEAPNCQKYYQCFNGYAYLLNCYDGYAFDGQSQSCVPIQNTNCSVTA